MFSHLHLMFLLLLLLLVVVLLLLLVLLLASGLLALGCLGVSLLLAGPDSAPLGQLGLRSLVPLGQLVLPHALQPLGSHNLGAALVELLPVAVGPGVRPALVLGEHVDRGGVGATEGLGVQTLLDGFVSQLKLSPLVQFFEFVVLVYPSLFIIVFVSLQLYNGVPDGVSLVFQLVRVHGLQGEGFDSDTQGDLHLLLHLLLRLGHLLPGVHGGSLGLLTALLLLGSHHLLTLPFSLLHGLLLLRGLGVSLLLLLPLQFQLLGPLLLSSLLLLQSLQLLLLLGPLVPPLGDVVLQLSVKLIFFGLDIVRSHDV